LLNHGHFAESDFDGFAETDDAVGRETAGKIASFEEGNVVAEFGKFASAAEASRSSTYYRNGLLCGSGDEKKLYRFAVDEIHSVALQTADGDGFVIDAEYASAFAQFLNRADAGASGTE
jgi:hypothetical protein